MSLLLKLHVEQKYEVGCALAGKDNTTLPIVLPSDFGCGMSKHFDICNVYFVPPKPCDGQDQ